MKRLLVSLGLLFATPLWAATYFVRQDTGVQSVSGSDTVCNGLTDQPQGALGVNIPNCAFGTPQKALATVANNDTITIHAGTYGASSTVHVSGTGADDITSLNVTKNGITIQRFGSDVVTINGASTAQSCVLAQSPVSGLTINGLVCQSHLCGLSDAGTDRRGIIWAYATSGQIIVRNTTINSAYAQNAGEFSCGAVRIQAGDSNSIIENNVFSGHLGHAVLYEVTSGGTGAVVRNNTITASGGSANDAERTFVPKGCTGAGPLVFYNNRITSSGAPQPMFFTRESATPIYVFDNIYSTTNGSLDYVDTQDNSTPDLENEWIFNNTFVGSVAQAIHWQDHFSSLHVRNNIFDGSGNGVRGDTSIAPGNTSQAWSTSTDKFTTNIMEHASGAILDTAHTPDPTGHVDPTGTIISAGALTSRDSNNNLTASTVGLGGGFLATNDPINQGPNTCTITAANIVINCALDINGLARGLTWDAGADQFASGGQTCGNNVVEGSEVCDDGNTVTDACIYGDSPPFTQVCNSTCTALVNCTAPQYCGDGVINGPEQCDGAALNSQTCISLGFVGGGTLSCTLGCTFDTSQCSGGTPTLTFFQPQGAVLTGGSVH